MSVTGVNGSRQVDGGQAHDERYDQVRLGALIRSHRQSARLSQEELAHRAGLSVRSVRNLEVGAVARPHADTIRRLGRALGLDTAQVGRLASIARPEREPAPAKETGPGPADPELIAISRRLRWALANLPADKSRGNVVLLPVVLCCDHHALPFHALPLHARAAEAADSGPGGAGRKAG